MNPSDVDSRVRLASFRWLDEQVEMHGEVLPWSLLLHGFTFEGTRVPLLSQQGIFKPKVLPEIPLSIRTSPSGPYDDHTSPDGRLLYRYRGTNPKHRDNAGLQAAMRRHVPLVYFYGLDKGKYFAVWPVFIVGDDPGALTFTVEVDDAQMIRSDAASEIAVAESGADIRRSYVTATFRRRLHQARFRERVLRAYRERCALCRLRHEELLEAVHIVPDRDVGGVPEVTNGLALCRLHHAAFDRYFIGIRPDYVVEVRRDVLEEKDGPMLLHGLQGLYLSEIHRPHRRADFPDPQRLLWRYERFREAS